MEKIKLIAATGNKNKLREFEQIFSSICPVEVIPAKSLVADFDPEETGTTFIANAWIKVDSLYNEACRDIGDCIILADDSGLCVDYINGEPGVYSARYADDEGYHHDDIANVNKLLRVLEGVSGDERSARFVCAIAARVVKNGKIHDLEAIGYLEGRIAYEPAGDGGFGYDPVLYIPEYDMTVAQMSAQLKNEISHRGKALKIAVESIKEIF